MIKALRRLFTAFFAALVALAAIGKVFKWLARNENDEYEVFADDEREEAI